MQGNRTFELLYIVCCTLSVLTMTSGASFPIVFKSCKGHVKIWDHLDQKRDKNHERNNILFSYRGEYVYKRSEWCGYLQGFGASLLHGLQDLLYPVTVLHVQLGELFNLCRQNICWWDRWWGEVQVLIIACVKLRVWLNLIDSSGINTSPAG